MRTLNPPPASLAMRLRNTVLALVAGIIAILVITVFATIGLAVLGGVAVAAIAGAVLMRLKGGRPPKGVRRDAHGTIIDM